VAPNRAPQRGQKVPPEGITAPQLRHDSEGELDGVDNWICVSNHHIRLIIVKGICEITDMSKCEVCGRDISADSVYCTFCGMLQVSPPALPAEEEPEDSNSQFSRKCLTCGFMLRGAWEFCPRCGVSRPRAGVKFVGVISLLAALLSYIAGGGFYFGNYYYDPIVGVFAIAMIVAYAFVGFGLLLSRHPLIWWVSVTLWFLTGLEALFLGYFSLGLYEAFVSAIIVTYLVVVRRSFAIVTL
jgi:hypothetical protein